jgi:aspartate-semialdehyde dehydrogenase
MTNHSQPTLAIVGATGAVGGELTTLLDEGVAQGRFSGWRIRLLASGRSAGRVMSCMGREIAVEALDEACFDGVDVAVFAAGGDVSRRFVPVARDAGVVVIDNSSAFRMTDDVPLVVPEINAAAMADIALGRGSIIANPNCSTILMAVVVWPIARRFGVERLIISTYQAVSGAGAAAMRELESQTRSVLDGRAAEPDVFPVPCAFNVFSHDSTTDASTGRNVEEEKMIRETAKIFGSAGTKPPVTSPRISCTCIRVPVLRAHSESINIGLSEPADPETIREVLSAAPGIRVVDDRSTGRFPTPLDASGRNEVLVGRIRRDSSRSDGRGIDLFLCGDQLRKGAALNALQIAAMLTCG